jgi:hypothetical protein
MIVAWQFIARKDRYNEPSRRNGVIGVYGFLGKRGPVFQTTFPVGTKRFIPFPTGGIPFCALPWQ